MSAPRVTEFFRGAVHDLRIRPRGNVPALDVLRSLAILLVFTAHYGAAFQAVPRVQALPIFNWGWTGVDLFFVLSGFLIGGQLWKEVSRTQPHPDWALPAASRPAHLAALLCLCGVGGFRGTVWAQPQRPVVGCLFPLQ